MEVLLSGLVVVAVPLLALALGGTSARARLAWGLVLAALPLVTVLLVRRGAYVPDFGAVPPLLPAVLVVLGLGALPLLLPRPAGTSARRLVVLQALHLPLGALLLLGAWRGDLVLAYAVPVGLLGLLVGALALLPRPGAAPWTAGLSVAAGVLALGLGVAVSPGPLALLDPTLQAAALVRLPWALATLVLAPALAVAALHAVRALLPDRLPPPLATVASWRSLRQLRRLTPVRRAALYPVVRREVPLVAPVALHAASGPALVAGWALLRETWLAAPLPVALREAVVQGVSEGGACPYCAQTHRLFAAAAGGRDDLAAARAWGRAVPSGGARGPLPVPADQAVPLLALVLGYLYANRLVNVFVVPDQLRATGPLLPLLERAFTTVVGRRLVRTPLAPGRALPVLPPADLPADLAWADGDVRLATVLAGTADMLDREAERVAPPGLRPVLEAALHGWTGGTPRAQQSLARAPRRGAGAARRRCRSLRVARRPGQLAGRRRAGRPGTSRARR